MKKLILTLLAIVPIMINASSKKNSLREFLNERSKIAKSILDSMKNNSFNEENSLFLPEAQLYSDLFLRKAKRHSETAESIIDSMIPGLKKAYDQEVQKINDDIRQKEKNFKQKQSDLKTQYGYNKKDKITKAVQWSLVTDYDKLDMNQLKKDFSTMCDVYEGLTNNKFESTSFQWKSSGFLTDGGKDGCIKEYNKLYKEISDAYDTIPKNEKDAKLSALRQKYRIPYTIKNPEIEKSYKKSPNYSPRTVPIDIAYNDMKPKNQTTSKGQIISKNQNNYNNSIWSRTRLSISQWASSAYELAHRAFSGIYKKK